MEDAPTHYQVLDVSRSFGADSDLSAQHLKAAYRRALFHHHPDKTRAQTDSEHDQGVRKNPNRKTIYTIDQITEAYATLSNPKLRFEYDRILKLRTRRTKGTGQAGDDQAFHSGLDTVDLSDLSYDELEIIWFKSCRCGDERGFQIHEADLEEASDVGELHVGCRGCSLWLKVLFGVIEGNTEIHIADCG